VLESTHNIDDIVDSLFLTFSPEMLEEWSKENQYLKYQEDPVLFGQEVLNENYTDDIQKLMASVRDHQYTVAMSSTAVGKTHGAASIAIWWYKCFPNSQVWTAAAPPEDNLRKLLWGEINKKIIRNPDIMAGDKINDLHISRASKVDSRLKESWFITGVAIPQSGSEQIREAKFSGKHSAYLLFIIDEGDGVPDEVYRGIDGCMSGGHARLLIMFNPKQESGRVYQMIRNGEANVVQLSAFNHPNVFTGRNLIPGAVTRMVTARRINKFSVPISSEEEPDNECFEVPDFLVGFVAKNERGIEYPPIPAGWRRVQEHEFHYKVLGQYPPSGSNVLISRDWIDAARSRWDLFVAAYGENALSPKTPHDEDNPLFEMRPIIGQDVADLGDDWNVTCRRYGGFVARLSRWRGVDPTETSDKAVDLAKHYKSQCVNVDSIGVGASVAPAIRKKGVKSNRVMVSEKPTKKIKDIDKKAEFGTLRDQLWWDVREWLRTDPGSMLPPEPKLIEELASVTYEEHLGKIKIMSKEKMRSTLGRSPDDAESLILTFAPKEQRPRIRLVG